MTTDTTTTIDTESALPSGDAILTRRETAAALRAAGYPMTVKNLGQLGYKEVGPPFHHRGHATFYKWSEALEWAENRPLHTRRPPALGKLDPALWKDRVETARLLQEAGFSYKATTLSVYASVDEGPPYVVFGGRAYYNTKQAMAWAAERWETCASHRRTRKNENAVTRE